jgi:serine/threonine-protein kinase
MATVWVAFDKTNRIEVALKTMSLDLAGWRAEVRDRFMKEARLLARGKHEHLVGVRDVGETDDGFLYIVLDLLDGETLADRLARETQIEWREALVLGLGITRGVAALHHAGIVHRDLKPANVVLHRAEFGIVPTIIDLGIGKASGVVGDPQLCATLTATGQVLGTPQYMSYEQALGQTDIDARTDVWALGVILYEMITGSRPFEAPNANAVLAAIRRHNIRPIRDVAPDVPLAAARIVERCLITDRSERVADAEALANELQAAIKNPSGVSGEAPVATQLPRTQRRPLQQRFVVAIISSAIMLSMIAFAIARTMNAAPGVAPDVVASAEASSFPAVPLLRLATNSTPAQSTVARPPNDVQPSSVPTARTTGSSARNRAPLSRVNEAGF